VLGGCSESPKDSNSNKLPNFDNSLSMILMIVPYTSLSRRLTPLTNLTNISFHRPDKYQCEVDAAR